MISELAYDFLKNNLTFFSQCSLDAFPMTENEIGLLKKNPKINHTALFWVDEISDELVEKVGDLDYEQIVLLLKGNAVRIRRAESLIGTKIKRMYRHIGGKVSLEDIYRICTESFEKNNSPQENIGITRLLKIPASESNGKQSVFECIFFDHCIVESPKNVKIACLQLKGKRASAVVVEEFGNDTLGSISKIMKDEKNDQILINISEMSAEEKKAVNESYPSFTQMAFEDTMGLFQNVNELDLPVLNERIWDKKIFYINEMLKDCMKKEPFYSDSISIEGEDSLASVAGLKIPASITVNESTASRQENTLMRIKSRVLSKSIIILNLSVEEIQKDLLRMLYQASTSSFTVICVGPAKNYTELFEFYKKFKENRFYKKRQITILHTSEDNLSKTLDSLSVTKPSKAVSKSQVDKTKPVEHREAVNTVVQGFYELENSFSEAYKECINRLTKEFSNIASILIISDNDSYVTIKNNILELYNWKKGFQEIFENPEELKLFQSFMKLITPESSRTEFPVNEAELILITKALIYKILGSKLTDRGDHSKTINKIWDIGLLIDPYDKNIRTLNYKVEKNRDWLKSIETIENVKISTFLDQLSANIKDIEKSLVQIFRQVEFLKLALPKGLVAQSAVHPADIAKPGKRNDIPPFRQLSAIESKIHSERKF